MIFDEYHTGISEIHKDKEFTKLVKKLDLPISIGDLAFWENESFWDFVIVEDIEKDKAHVKAYVVYDEWSEEWDCPLSELTPLPTFPDLLDLIEKKWPGHSYVFHPTPINKYTIEIFGYRVNMNYLELEVKASACSKKREIAILKVLLNVR